MGRKANLKRVKRIADKLPNVNMLDHHKNMKDRYNKSGAVGVQEYVEAISSAINKIKTI